MVMEEKGYRPNSGMPAFVGNTEIKRLNKVLDEKNALIEKFRKYDEERKAYYAERMEEYEEMKNSFDQFSEELLKVVDDGDMEQSEYRKFLKLYRNWFIYKANADLYKSKLADARDSVRDLREDIKKLEDSLVKLDIDKINDLEVLALRMCTMRKHLDTLQMKMSI